MKNISFIGLGNMGFEMAINSSKLAPAQNVRSPPLCKTITLIEGSLAAVSMVSVRIANKDAGNAL